MKIRSYLEMVGLTRDEKVKALAEPRAKQAELELQMAVQKCNEEMAQAELNIQEAITEHPLSVGKLIDAHKCYAIQVWKKNTLLATLGDLFPTKVVK